MRFNVRNVLFGVVAAVLFIGLLVYLSIGQGQVRVEVCVSFQGRQNCRIAAGPTEEQAIRTATDNACATIASGMTESMTCGRMPPVSVRRLN
ncbi:MAG TPA: hypothetical protein VES20_08690 [Bryobacteraceae bacterium]|nr:hypothetical protein [Bryobacteraceae bacterium]